MDIFLRRPNGRDVCVAVTSEDFTVHDALTAARLVDATLSCGGVVYDGETRLRDLGLQDGDTLDVRATEAAAARQFFKGRNLKMTYDALVSAVASRNEERVRGLLHCVSLTEGERNSTQRCTASRNSDATRLSINEGLPVLMVAVQYSTPSIVRLLFSAGADPNERGSAQNAHCRRRRRAGDKSKPTALHFAAKIARDSGNMEVLLDAGADPNPVDAFSATPLMILAERKDDVSDLIGFLVARGAEVNKVAKRKMALGRAVMRGHVANVRALLQHGAVGVGGVLRLPRCWGPGRRSSAFHTDAPASVADADTKAILRLCRQHRVRVTNYDRDFTYAYLQDVHRFQDFESHEEVRRKAIAALSSRGVTGVGSAGDCVFTLEASWGGPPSWDGLRQFFRAVLECRRHGSKVCPRPTVSPRLLKQAEELFRQTRRSSMQCENDLFWAKEDNDRRYHSRRIKGGR